MQLDHIQKARPRHCCGLGSIRVVLHTKALASHNCGQCLILASSDGFDPLFFLLSALPLGVREDVGRDEQSQRNAVDPRY